MRETQKSSGVCAPVQLCRVEVPDELKLLPAWLCWRAEHYEGEAKSRKIPYWAGGGKRHGVNGSPEDRAKLVTFPVALAAAQKLGMTGVGFAPHVDFGITILDVDKCVGPDGELPAEIEALASRTYAEYSPSGTGIHIVMRGNLGDGRSQASETTYGLDVFSTKAFITFTGAMLPYTDFLGLENTIAPADAAARDLVATRGRERSAPDISDNFLAGHEPPLGLSVSQIERILSYISPDCGRDEWIRAGLALHHETQGDDTGLALFDEWSSDGATYPGTEGVEYQWNSFSGPTPGRPCVTMATVIYMAKKNGYVHASSGKVSAGPVPAEIAPVRLPAPFPGFMADAVKCVLETAIKRQPDMTALGVLVAMAATCSGHVQLSDGTCLNLYGFCIAATSTGKDHVLRGVQTIATAGGAKILGDFASGAGVEDVLADHANMVAVIDEIAHVFASRGERGNPQMREVEKMLLRLFSASSAIYTTRLKAGGSTRTVHNPCLSLFGTAVPDKLGAALGSEDVVSGLLNRMFVALGDSAAAPKIGKRVKLALPEALQMRLDEVRTAGKLGVTVDLSEPAERMRDELVWSIYEEEQRLPEEAPERLLRGRTLEKAIRVAGILAVFGNPSQPIIGTEHLEWAVNFARASDETLLRFINDHMHGGEVQANAVRVMRAMKALLEGGAPKSSRSSELSAIEQGYAPVSLVMKRVRLSAREVDEAIGHLIMRGDVVRSTQEFGPGKHLNILTFAV